MTNQIHDSKTIEFRIRNIRKYNKHFGSYNRKCEVACIDSDRKYLSRIIKNNEYHYYLLKEYTLRICDCCGKEGCTSSYCRGSLEDTNYYRSKYIGTNFENVLKMF